MWEIKTLGRADDERARDMLEKTAWQVQPIMRKRGWKVQELCEMKPEQRDRVGDNLNMGQRVRLKLRKNNSGDWFDYDHVVLVMLHELCHNDIGPHNANSSSSSTRSPSSARSSWPRESAEAARGSTRRVRDWGTGAGGAESRREIREGRRGGGGEARGVPGRHGTRGGQKTGRGAGAATQLGPREAAAAAERRLRAERFARRTA